MISVQLPDGSKREYPGPVTVAEVAAQAGRSQAHVRRAIHNGVLAAAPVDGQLHATRTDATRWIARGCPSGDGEAGW